MFFSKYLESCYAVAGNIEIRYANSSTPLILRQEKIAFESDISSFRIQQNGLTKFNSSYATKKCKCIQISFFKYKRHIHHRITINI